MKYNSTRDRYNQNTIHDVMPTDELLSGRGGLILFVRYLKGIGICPHLERLFGSIRRNGKGLPVSEIFKQVLCFFVDGTSRHIVYFDHLKEDAGYAQTIETTPRDMLSSHAVKRFFRSFWWPRIFLFRRLLEKLFLWRLNIEKPEVVILGLDVMVMDNDDAPRRHGVKPTYKKVKGFAPLQLTWGRFIIDAVFRSGDKHSNHSDTVQKMVKHVVGEIRKHYNKEVPIVLRCDGAFFDQKVFDCFEELGIGYICVGRLLSDIKAVAASAQKQCWQKFQTKKTLWEYMEFGDRRGNWKKFRRVIYCRRVSEDRQLPLDFARSHTVFYTNLGTGEPIDGRLRASGLSHFLDAERLIRDYHQRGKDELIHRAFKEFASEKLPFKRFAQNAAFYYTTLLAFFLYETFKQDVCAPAIEPVAYPTKLRRKGIDIAAKIIRHAGRIILKVPHSVYKHLHFDQLWKRSAQPPIFHWV